ncbi:uncharacterized protein LOC132164678 isoform X2 [Corylus avellana]|uniref:uncharacterized protein LOC132164678 isoform X2 n=1 Tax=Corylus avellana TaxID=13451 RepID=UPI00286B02CA|nr:uncharacterized protein LOC132164678 isoform X2 [Corylus avellana]
MDGKFENWLSNNSAHDAKDKVLVPNCVISGGIRFHPDVEALSSIEDRDPLGNASESASCNAHLEKRDAMMKLWQEMKQNGFLLPPACTPAPGKDAMKHRHDMASRKKKVAKIEQQVNRFTKVVAPSGLLEELNPGIINRLRNSKHVYSVIGALVRGEKLENTRSMQQSRFKKKIRDNDLNERSNTLSGGSQVSGYLMCQSRPMHINSEHEGGVACDLSVAVRKGEDHGDDKHEVRSWSFENTASENVKSDYETVSTENTSSQEESAETAMDSPFDPKALRCSRMRVQDVLQQELPFLISKEFSSIKKDDQFSAVECPISIIACSHQVKWTALFGQMDEALQEEMNHLEIWLNQVEEMHTRAMCAAFQL